MTPKEKVGNYLSKLEELGCPQELVGLITSLDTPIKVQGYLNKLPYNHNETGETACSSVGVEENKTAHCFEGAIFAYTCLWFHGYNPKIVVIQANNDLDHNLVIYRKDNKLGAVAQSGHKELKGRPPKFDSLGDLILSYEPFYTSDWPGFEGLHTMAGYTDPIDLVKKFGTGWFFLQGNLALWEIYKHYTDDVWCTSIRQEGNRYLYPPEEQK